MSAECYELEVHRQQSNLGLSNNCGTGQPMGGYLQSMLGPQWSYCHCPPSPSDFELTISQVSDADPLLNYGAKLRLVIADPIKGIDLREAISKLKIALKEAYRR